jgi:hypothetical protein
MEDDVLWIGSAEAAHPMRKWTIPALALLSLGGITAYLLSRKNKPTVSESFQEFVDTLSNAPAHLEQWSEDAQHELDDIRSAVENIAASIGNSNTQKA